VLVCNLSPLQPSPIISYAFINMVVYLAMQANAHAADYLTPGSNSSIQTANESTAPELTMAFAKESECLATDLSTKHAAFL
jgi:hypothetical protein